jgi:hypothetical protein
MNKLVGLASGFVLALTASQTRAGEKGVGLTLDYEEIMAVGQVSGVDVTDHYDAVGISGVFDTPFLRLTAGYSTNIGNQIRFADGDETKDDGYRIKYLNVTALGKYPFELARGKLRLWPALGLRGAYNLQHTYDGDGTRFANDEPHDLLVVGGIGADYDVSTSMALTASLLGTYDLTPSMGSGVDDLTQFSAGLGVGMLFRW